MLALGVDFTLGYRKSHTDLNPMIKGGVVHHCKPLIGQQLPQVESIMSGGLS